MPAGPYETLAEITGGSVADVARKTEGNRLTRMNLTEEETKLQSAWIRELHLEHEDICWRYNVSLPRPVIEISGARRQWGAWDPDSRTIKVSAHMITGHSWDVTLNVFKHEMAHQIVSEVFGASEGHGFLFERACAIIGVPEAFRGAGGDVPRRTGAPIDEEMGSENMRRLDKVRKLLSLARSANENEALLAMQKANELIEKYNIERIEQDEAAGFVYAIINHKKKRIENYQRGIGHILSDHFFVDVVYAHLYDPADCVKYRTMELLGTVENVHIAEYVYYFLMNQMEVLWKSHKRKAAGPVSGNKRSYRLGVLKGFHDKLDQQAAKRRRVYRPDARGVKSLSALVLAEDGKLKEFIGMRFPRLEMCRPARARIDSGAFHAGMDDGERLNLHKGIRQRDGYRGRFLPCFRMDDS